MQNQQQIKDAIVVAVTEYFETASLTDIVATTPYYLAVQIANKITDYEDFQKAIGEQSNFNTTVSGDVGSITDFGDVQGDVSF